MMLQPGNSKSARITLPVKDEPLRPQKCATRGRLSFWGYPIAIYVIMLQYVYALMSGYVLLIRHDNFELFALRHRVNTIMPPKAIPLPKGRAVQQFMPCGLLIPCPKGVSWLFSELNNSAL
jgi:hypothetical protein